jgi:hypothetical protein
MDKKLDTIIAGRFGTKAEADVVAAQIRGFVSESDVCIFHNNPPGQHRTTVFGDDDLVRHEALHPSKPTKPNTAAEAEASEQAEQAENTSMATAAVAGVAVGTLAVAAGPVAALAAAGVAAYTGSLAGALSGSGGDNQAGGADHQGDHAMHSVRQGGAMIAIRIANPENQARVVDALRGAGADDIEIASGEWQDGDWVDFDPLEPPHLIDAQSPAINH